MRRMEIFEKTRSNLHHTRKKTESGRDEASLQAFAERVEGRVLKEGEHSVIEVDQRIEKDSTHGSVRLSEIESIRQAPLGILFPKISDPQGILDQKRFLFFDIETTGLSMGAGTRFFLIGMLKAFGGELRLLQYFLVNLRSEPLFLRMVKEKIGDNEVLVSYNGKTFDYNVMRSRYILNGLDLDELERVHLDLLYPSRRLWKGLCSDFTLGTVESDVLGFRRDIDIPGERIPEVYSRYLREGYAGDDLCRIFIHNRNDILSLAALLLHQVHTVQEGTAQESRQAFNRVSLSDMLSRSGFIDEAKNVLLSRKLDAEAARRLGLLCKRERAYDEALDHFKRAARNVKSLSDYIFDCTEIAKIYEHRMKDYTEALSYARRAHERLLRKGFFHPGTRHTDARDIASLERRIERLEGKIEKRERL